MSLRQASVMIIQDSLGRVLLLERTGEHVHFPNEWCLPGGKRELNAYWIALKERNPEVISTEEDYAETIEETNYRETVEETGIKVYVFKRLNVTLMDDKFECVVFKAIGTYYEPDASLFPNREHNSWNWYHTYDLPITLGKMTRILLEHLDEI